MEQWEQWIHGKNLRKENGQEEKIDQRKINIFCTCGATSFVPSDGKPHFYKFTNKYKVKIPYIVRHWMFYDECTFCRWLNSCIKEYEQQGTEYLKMKSYVKSYSPKTKKKRTMQELAELRESVALNERKIHYHESLIYPNPTVEPDEHTNHTLKRVKPYMNSPECLEMDRKDCLKCWYQRYSYLRCQRQDLMENLNQYTEDRNEAMESKMYDEECQKVLKEKNRLEALLFEFHTQLQVKIFG